MNNQELVLSRFRIARYSLIPFVGLLTITFTIIFFRFRNRYLIRLRYPSLVHCTNIWIIILSIQSLVLDQPCWLLNSSRYLVIPVIGNGIMLRCYYTLKRFQQQQEITKELSEKRDVDLETTKARLTQIQKFLAGRNLGIVYAICFFVWIVVLTAIALNEPGFFSTRLLSESDDNNCNIGTRMVFFVPAVAFVYGIGYIVLAIKMRKVQESLKIILELKLCASAALVVVLGSIGTAFIKEKKLKSDVYYIFGVVAELVVFFASTIMPVWFSFGLRDFNNSPSSSSMDVANSQDAESLPNQKITMEYILQNQGAREEFKKFLRLEFCAENLQFLEAVDKYKQLEDDKLVDFARLMIKNFIGVSSRYPVNISGEVVSGIETTLKTLGDNNLRDIFDNAYNQVLHLLKHDPFPRFLKKREVNE